MSNHSIIPILLLVLAATACAGQTQADEPARLTSEEDWEVASPEVSETGEWIDGDERVQLPFWAVGSAVRIDNELIPARKFNELALTHAHLKLTKYMYRSYVKVVFDRLVSDHLIDSAVQEANIHVTPEEVDKELATILERYETQEEKDEFFKSMKLSPEEYRASVREKLLRQRFLVKAYEIEIREEDLETYYKRYKSRYDKKPEVKARHILIKLDRNASPSQIEEARETAQRISEQAKQPGADFAELARQHSEGPTATKGGNLGYFQANRMVKPFSDAAFAMNAGDVSEPVRTRFGWHIIKVEDKKPARTIPFEEARDEIYERLLARETTKALNLFLRRARGEHDIEYLTRNIRYHQMQTPESQPRFAPETQPRFR